MKTTISIELRSERSKLPNIKQDKKGVWNNKTIDHFKYFVFKIQAEPLSASKYQ